MNREVSAYLDCVRLLCALLVLAAHVELNWVPGIWHFLVPLGNESLAVLFTLSGFVIGYVSHKRETTMRAYLIHRAARVYSVLLPCLVLGFLLDATGKHFMTHYYTHGSWPPLGSNFRQFFYAIFSLTFLGEVWGANFFPGSMAPYWSLPYEVAFYLVFGSAWYLRGRQRWIALGILCLLAGWPVLVFFPLWMLGWITYRLTHRLRLSQGRARAIFLGTLGLMLLAEIAAARTGFDFGYGDQESPEIWPYYLSGLVFVFLTLGFRFGNFTIGPYTGWARWAAGASATLYLLHFSVGRFANGLVPFGWPRALRWALVVLPILLASLLLAHFFERRKEVWRRKIELWLPYIERFLSARKGTSFSEEKEAKRLL